MLSMWKRKVSRMPRIRRNQRRNHSASDWTHIGPPSYITQTVGSVLFTVWQLAPSSHGTAEVFSETGVHCAPREDKRRPG